MADLGITIFDPADALTSPEYIAAYLDLAAEEAGHDAEDILKAMRVAVRASGSIATAATKAGMTPQKVEIALAEGERASFETVLRILFVLGVRIRFEVDSCRVTKKEF